MGLHDLHSILINNPKYNFHEDDDVDVSIEYSSNSFKGKLAQSLNNEQKIAVKFISKPLGESDSQSNPKSDIMVPYLLFGPAG